MTKSTSFDPATALAELDETKVGSVFVSNYPPYSSWDQKHLDGVRQILDQKPKEKVPLGLYLHIPFCRKRCKFCYFKVYTGKNSDEIQNYLDGLVNELEVLAQKPVAKGRKLDFLYFGGGTPSFLSGRQLQWLLQKVGALFDISDLQEFSFECEPGTLTESKVKTLKKLGVTRLSLGVEHFDDFILSSNGRAHVGKEIERCLPWIKEAGFDTFNFDLIAGMLGETEKKWQETVARALEVGADCLTVYQMELPYNTVYSGHLREGDDLSFADWKTKRNWNDFVVSKFLEAGYVVSSAYTMAKPGTQFVYRDALWHGADLLGAGISSFSHVQGTHYQNAGQWDEYLTLVNAGKLPLTRGYVLSTEDRFIREWILQMKLTKVDLNYFRNKFGIDPIERFSTVLTDLKQSELVDWDQSNLWLTRAGALRVDPLLPKFYAEQFQNTRYT